MKIRCFIGMSILLSHLALVAQERDKDTIDNQTVKVVKAYVPTISDAFKIRDTPLLNDANLEKKKPVVYNIFSIPVASTFTPAKGRAATIDKMKPVKLYDNYASLGAGSYTALLGELYLNYSLNTNETVGGYFKNHSALSTINSSVLDSKFSETALKAYYAKQQRDLTWKIEGGFDFLAYNWYGLPSNIYAPDAVKEIDPLHTFTGFNFGGKVVLNDALISQGRLDYRYFGDNQGSAEHHLNGQTQLDLPIQDYSINTALYLDILEGSFDKAFNTSVPINYGNITLGILPKYRITEEDFTIDLGVRLVYLNAKNDGDNSFFVYPAIEASYNIVETILMAYGGITGQLQQNTYHNFATDNPFVSPSLQIRPTNQRYNGCIGLKGKLSNRLSFDLKANYYNEEDKALFKANNALTSATENYHYGNSFGIVYDDVTTVSVTGHVNANLNRNFTIGAKATYFNYGTKRQAKAWNLPNLEASAFMDLQISEVWYAGASVYFVGERNDSQIIENSVTQDSIAIALDAYVDVNAHLGYRVNSQLSLFAKVNNLLNQDYQRYSNFEVQGFQFLAGATYQFDF